MNREIKFRGIREEYNPAWHDSIFKYGNLLNSNSIGEVGYDLDHYEFAKVKPETIGQYTGLKDRNGKEIYEGDIIFRTDVYSEVKQTIVYWNAKFIASNRKRPEGNAWKSDNGKSYDLSFLLNLNNDWRVIGNIYENPELINQ